MEISSVELQEKIKNGEKIDSIENRGLFFDGLNGVDHVR